MSKLNISNKLTKASIPKAIGEIIPTAFVNDSCNNVVNTSPKTIIETITPDVVINPNNMNAFFISLISEPFDSLLDKKARKPGYKGKTQTAASGANNPAKKDSHRFVSVLIILASLNL